MKTLLVITALFGALGVALGAFGAHGLEGKITEAQIAVWNTAVKYQMIHVIAALVLLLNSPKEYRIPAMFFLLGILFFSGSLYLLSTKDLLNLGSFTKVLGPITPLGGLLYIIGWLSLAFQFFKS